jgi:hypothetical protein
MEMNRGRIGVSSSTGHVHSLDDLADVEITDPQPGDVLVFGSDGIWRNQPSVPPKN